jgi:heme/copper-type cytochrome/quinol oxidase subunit 4
MQGRRVPAGSIRIADPDDNEPRLTNRKALAGLAVAVVGWLPFGALSPVAIALGLAAFREMRTTGEQGGTAAYFAVVIGLVGLAHPIWWLHEVDPGCLGEHPIRIVMAYMAPVLLATLAVLVAGHRSWNLEIRGLIVLGLAAGIALATFDAFVFSATALMAGCL